MKKYFAFLILSLFLGALWLLPGQAGPVPATAPGARYQYRMVVVALPLMEHNEVKEGPKLDLGGGWEVYDVQPAPANLQNPPAGQPTTGCIVYSLRRPL